MMVHVPFQKIAQTGYLNSDLTHAYGTRWNGPTGGGTLTSGIHPTNPTLSSLGETMKQPTPAYVSQHRVMMNAIEGLP